MTEIPHFYTFFEHAVVPIRSSNLRGNSSEITKQNEMKHPRVPPPVPPPTTKWPLIHFQLKEEPKEVLHNFAHKLTKPSNNSSSLFHTKTED